MPEPFERLEEQHAAMSAWPLEDLSGRFNQAAFIPIATTAPPLFG